HTNSGQQDNFELFARDFLEYRGYKIISQPGRGADGGADLIVEEVRTGIGGETNVKWLVSCKHFAHSGNSVTPSLEQDILDRVRSKGCSGFIGFYSTLPSSALIQRLEGLKVQIEHQLFDAPKIEKLLLESNTGVELASRYFFNSMKSWKQNNPSPVNIFSDAESLKCMNCGDELLLEEPRGIIVVLRKIDWPDNDDDLLSEDDWPVSEEPPITEILDVYWCCKGECDKNLKRQYQLLYPKTADSWMDIPNLCIPTVYIKMVLATINRLYAKERYLYTTQAIEKMKSLIAEIFPYVVRELTEKEKREVASLMTLPSSFGGLG
ncbi:MAG: restriction endonuclease, partial [Anaerolineae bacterium]|nr:restriction endonuclease [Anaerolineae bacterium]